MPNIGASEILVILLVALLVLGPDKLPSAARTVGRTMSQIRNLSRGFEDEVRGAMKMADLDPSATSTARPATDSSSTLHPGLSSGPKLDAGSVDLGAAPTTSDTGSVRAQGPTESFS